MHRKLQWAVVIYCQLQLIEFIPGEQMLCFRFHTRHTDCSLFTRAESWSSRKASTSVSDIDAMHLTMQWIIRDWQFDEYKRHNTKLVCFNVHSADSSITITRFSLKTWLKIWLGFEIFHTLNKTIIAWKQTIVKRGPIGPWGAHLRKGSKVTVEPYPEDH